MNIIHITAGAGGMYCGGCFRDNALVGVLRKMGHSTLMIPVYLPLTLEEEDQSQGTPIFFGGISVYIEQKFPLFSKFPRWMHRLLASPKLLRWAARNSGGSAAKTRPEDLGGLTLSMLLGEEGRQARELEVLIDWIRTNEKPDIICLSNALLIGMARRLKQELKVPVVCTFQGEDSFLNSLPSPYREKAWSAMAERSQDINSFIAPSHYFAGVMQSRLSIPPEKMKVIFNGINLDGFAPAAPTSHPDQPVLGYFARMCPEKGLDQLIRAFLILKKEPRWKTLQLHVGGGLGPSDEPFVNGLKSDIEKAGHSGAVTFFPNLDRAQKQNFFQSLTIFSAPALYGEAFGLYVIEALASGVPVVQPRHAAFPEILEATGGGLLAEPGNDASLAERLEELLAQPEKAREMGKNGRSVVERDFSIERMTAKFVELYETLRK